MSYKQLLSAVLVVFAGSTAKAQVLSSHFFVEAQGGVQFTSTNASISKLMTPTASFSVGRYFSPAVGARLHVNAWQSKAGIVNGEYYKWKYVTPDFDLMLNLSNILSPRSNHALNVILLGGVGLNYAWDNDELKKLSPDPKVVPLMWDDNRLSHNLRAGLRLETNLSKPLGLSFEVNANSLDDRFNSKSNGKDDWQFTAMLGLSYRFGYKYQKQTDRKHQKPTVLPTVVSLSSNDNLSKYQMMTKRLNAEMEQWAKRMPNESLDAYQLRVNDETRAAHAKELRTKISTEMATSSLSSNDVTLGKYNTNLKKLTVHVPEMPDIYLDVDDNEATTLYSNNKLKMQNARYNLKEDDSFELVYAEVLNPETGKTYVFDNMKNESLAYIAADNHFVTPNAMREAKKNETALTEIKDKTVAEARNDRIVSDKTRIYVSSKPEGANGVMDYNVTITYEVEEDFSSRDDFKPGRYKTEESNAAVLMLGIMKKAFANDFAKYIEQGKQLKMRIKGTADASPVTRPIAYDGKYGEHNSQPVIQGGATKRISLTSQEGITDNDKLALARALGVKNYIDREIPQLKKMKRTTDYEIEVSKQTGGKYRRISVQCTFVDAFK